MYFELKENKPHGTKDDPFSTYHIKNEGRSFQIPVHWHDELEIIYVKSGFLTVSISGENYIGTPGDAFVVSPGNLHFMGSQTGTVDYFTFLFPLKYISFCINDMLDDKLLEPLKNGHLMISPQVKDTAKELCEQFHLSEKYISRYFKEHFHITLSQYITHLRLEHAKQLLQDTDIPVTEIAMQSGYQNVSYFIRSFKKTYGVSPLKYRKNKSGIWLERRGYLGRIRKSAGEISRMSMGNKNKWWRNAVVYQIYPKSFQDSDGDGIGDIPGIISRLDYLKKLGIDAIWLSPVYRSPQDDNGYDISDYQDIEPMFGTMEDMEQLFAEAKKRGIRIMMDLVLNHTSDEHRWFLEAKKSKDNPYHDYYVWRDGEEGVYPNDMNSVFGGPAWEWVPELGQYYFHQFSVKQPDLNWENPKVRRELYDMILWWMEKGAGGFRLDVIDQIAKEPDLKITNNGPKLHEFLRELSRETFQKGDMITVGEAWGATPEIAKKYSNPDGSEFSMVFQFEHIMLDQEEGKEKWDTIPLNMVKLKKCLAKWQNTLYQTGWNSLFMNNHDLPRICLLYTSPSPRD